MVAHAKNSSAGRELNAAASTTRASKNDFSICDHGLRRCQQRSIKEALVFELISEGTQVDANVTFMKNKDVDRAIAKRKRQIQEFEKLRGCMVIHKENTIVSAYRPGKKKRKYIRKKEGWRD